MALNNHAPVTLPEVKGHRRSYETLKGGTKVTLDYQNHPELLNWTLCMSV